MVGLLRRTRGFDSDTICDERSVYDPSDCGRQRILCYLTPRIDGACRRRCRAGIGEWDASIVTISRRTILKGAGIAVVGAGGGALGTGSPMSRGAAGTRSRSVVRCDSCTQVGCPVRDVRRPACLSELCQCRSPVGGPSGEAGRGSEREPLSSAMGMGVELLGPPLTPLWMLPRESNERLGDGVNRACFTRTNGEPNDGP
jgi:hypothetical protein